MFKNITLEISLKPFKRTDHEYIKEVCEKIFSQWRPLIKDRETVSIMLWVGDGSELLDYAGDLSDGFEWCRFIGTANLPYLKEGEPIETSLHERKRDYIPDAPKMTYAVLKDIVSTLKSEGEKALPGVKIRVGETFDIGPEFALSDFKYVRHTEIISGSCVDRFGFIDATATLNADSRRYAAYPNGISDGTLFGTFLGRQAECFLKDLGFDYLWLSNGLGFSANPWDKTGKIFDGEKYYPEKLGATREQVFDFWKLFRKECSFPLETRGTNNSVGIDYASDGVPLYDIYNASLDITAPPNSPWAAINDNFGLEIMGHMTRICELPGERLPFRYYLHDPWWVNSPWYDRYDSSPSDIYLPMSISRINAEGKVESANSLALLSIDNSYGNMPDHCVNESVPHLLRAEKNAPDAVSPLVWVYPMREYTTSDSAPLLREMNLGDNFICDAINDGLPLSCVVSTDNFLKHDISLYKASVIISPVPENKSILDKLSELLNVGIGVIVYGTEEKLKELPEINGMTKVRSDGETSAIRKALKNYGFTVEFEKKKNALKPPALSVHKHDGAYFVSAYNPNTTTDAFFKFPLGAPILCGVETEIASGRSSYRFSRGEQRECRVFITQNDGVVSCREAAPVNERFRRSICIRGLEDATVCLFPETECECAASVQEACDVTPIFDNRFKPVHDEIYGDYLKGEHVSGDIYFLIGHRGTK